MELKPWELYRLAPDEFTALLKGWQKRDERTTELAAFVAANVMNVWLKKGRRVTVDKLLGRKKDKARTSDYKKKPDGTVDDLKRIVGAPKKTEDQKEREFQAIWAKVQRKKAKRDAERSRERQGRAEVS